MAVLFGHPDESSHGKKMEKEDLESSRDSSRRTPISGRFVVCVVFFFFYCYL